MAGATKFHTATVASKGILWHQLYIPWRNAWRRGNPRRFLERPLYLVTTPARAQPTLKHARSSCTRVSQLTSARLESIVRAAGRHRQASRSWDPESGAEVTVSRRLAASLLSGVPIGHAEFVQRTLAARLEEERRLLRELQEVPDMHSAWLLLLYRTGPPSPGRPQSLVALAAEVGGRWGQEAPVTSSDASHDRGPCARRGRCELLPGRVGSQMVGTAGLRFAARLGVDAFG